MEDNIIAKAKEDFSNIELTDSYVAKRYTKKFHSHLAGLVEASLNFTTSENPILKKKDIFISDDLYWQIEADVLENIDHVSDESILLQLDDLEDSIREGIIRSLGSFYRSSDLDLGKIIDYSVTKSVLAIKFNFMSNTDNINNPWEESKEILTDSKILHSFSNDLNYLKDLGVDIKLRKKDSEVISKHTIGVISKGKRDTYSGGYVRDLLGLRNTVIDIFEEHNSTSANPLKLEKIVELLHSMGVDELSDNEIKSWLIYPLKLMSKIGSNREGYFLLSDCGDILSSYDSHYENLRGYLRTLERHRVLATQKGCELDERFNRHKNLFK